MNVSRELQDKVVAEMMARRDNYGGTDTQYAQIYGIKKTIYSTLKTGKRDGLLTDGKWLNLARQLGIQLGNQRRLKFARTEVYDQIEEEVLFCKAHAKSMIFVDEPEIGKTVAMRHLAKTLPNAFYVDCSQNKGMIEHTRALATTIGLPTEGKIRDLKADIKYALNYMENPIVMLDEVGDLKYEAFLDLKEFWNGTEGSCAWYVAGADGLRAKIESGRANRKVGYAEIFSRWGSRWSKIVPSDPAERLLFYRKLLTDILTVNEPDRSKWEDIILRCLVVDEDERAKKSKNEKEKNMHFAGLRRLETILLLEEY